MAAKREYFFERSDFLIRALQSASQFNNGNPAALDDFLDWSLDQDSWEKYRPPHLGSTTVPPKLKSTDGWIYVARNQWHRESIFRIGHSKNDPQIKVVELNREQRLLTCQIGFYKLVKCVVVDDLKVAFPKLMGLVRKYRIAGSRAFFDISLEKLTEFMTEAVQSDQVTPANPASEFEGQIWVDIVQMKPHSSWQAWTAHCPSCRQLLRFRGAVCAFEVVICPSCGGQFRCRLGASRVELPGYMDQ